MSSAFIDTTVLTDILLKSKEKADYMKSALKRYSETLLPVYAIKEYKAGPMAAFVYVHNLLVNTRSIDKTLVRVQSLSRTLQRNLTSTSLEALADSGQSIAKMTTGDYVEKYGASANQQEMRCDEMRLYLKRKIIGGWKKRRQITTKVVNPLPCYSEESPKLLASGLIEIKPRGCTLGPGCCLQVQLIAEIKALEALKIAVDSQPTKRENQNRSRVLKYLLKYPKRDLDDAMCRNLGDAYFAFFAPKTSEVLTTNIKDHQPLANALGKNAALP